MARLRVPNKTQKDEESRRNFAEVERVVNDGDITNVKSHGAKGDGTTDDSTAFQAAIDAYGTVYVPKGTYYLATPVQFKKSGDGLMGQGPALSRLKCAAGALTPYPSQSAAIDFCVLSGLYIYPSSPTPHANSQSYADHTAIDFSGISKSVIRDVRTSQWRTHLDLGYSAYQTYKNRIDNLHAHNGATGVYIGGSASPRDGANANTFTGLSVMAMGVHIEVGGAFNSFTGTKIENPSQAAGYPLTSIGIQVRSGLYGVSNTFSDTYCELAGTGNVGLYGHYSGVGGWLTPNTFSGGAFSVNSAVTAPTLDAELSTSIYGWHVDVPGLKPTRRIGRAADGTSMQVVSETSGGHVTWKYGATWTAIVNLSYATAKPSGGAHIVGEIVYNKAPAASGYIGWTCVTAGTPGTWKGFGLIQA